MIFFKAVTSELRRSVLGTPFTFWIFLSEGKVLNETFLHPLSCCTEILNHLFSFCGYASNYQKQSSHRPQLLTSQYSLGRSPLSWSDNYELSLSIHAVWFSAVQSEFALATPLGYSSFFHWEQARLNRISDLHLMKAGPSNNWFYYKTGPLRVSFTRWCFSILDRQSGIIVRN